MKDSMIKTVLAVVVVALVFTAICGSGNTPTEYLRIHIRAQSNLTEDQNVKYAVKDKIVEYLTPMVSDCKSLAEVKGIVSNNLDGIVSVANGVLTTYGMEYTSSARISTEYFPTRDYDGVIFPEGEYQSLIVDLGSGKGDNWWCVLYPPLCFGGQGTGKVKYKSLIAEWIERIRGNDE